MKVSLEEGKKALDELIQEEVSREEIASWASIRQQAEDTDELEYDPSYEEKRIWEVISYLTGVDLKNIDGSYLHSNENFIKFREELNLGTPE